MTDEDVIAELVSHVPGAIKNRMVTKLADELRPVIREAIMFERERCANVAAAVRKQGQDMVQASAGDAGPADAHRCRRFGALRSRHHGPAPDSARRVLDVHGKARGRVHAGAGNDGQVPRLPAAESGRTTTSR